MLQGIWQEYSKQLSDVEITDLFSKRYGFAPQEIYHAKLTILAGPLPCDTELRAGETLVTGACEE